MYRRARTGLLALTIALISSAAAAQIVAQLTPAPRVSAENETWFRAGAPIEWNGGFYNQLGAPQAFDPYLLVPAGSNRGIPVYTSTIGQPDSRSEEHTSELQSQSNLVCRL